MSDHDDLLFGQSKAKAKAKPKDKFGAGQVSAKVRRENAKAMEAVDVADLIGSGEAPSASTGLDFGATAKPAAESAATVEPQPVVSAVPVAPVAATEKQKLPPHAPPQPAPQKRGFLAWLLGLLGFGD